MHGATHVVHLAARVHQPDADGEGARATMRRMNGDVTARLARAAAAAGAAHFVFASTIKVNGEATLPGRPFRESDPPDPHDDYATSKRDAELALAELAESTGLRVTSLRLPLTYGPGAKANFAALARAVRAGVPLPFAAIDNRRSLLGIGNFGDALATLLASDDAADRGRNTPYLLADAQPVSTPDLVRAIAARAGRGAAAVRVPEGAAALRGRVRGPRGGRRTAGRVARGRYLRLSRPLRMDAAAHACGRTRGRVRAGRAAIIGVPSREHRHAQSFPRPPSRPAARRALHARLHQACRRLGARRDGRHARAVHGQRRGGRAAVPQGQGPGLAHRRVRHAAARDQHADEARSGRRPPVGAHAGDPAPDRAQPARGHRSRRARRAHAEDRLRRAAGGRRHALCVDHRRLRRGRRRGRVVPRARPR